jgi:putative aldouronate transport system substrate-binding protein
MKKLLMLLIVVALAFSFVACNKTEETKAAAVADAPRELTVWEGLWANISVSVPTLDETPLYIEAQKRTGIDVTWIHPPQGQENENFNLMIASNELPDIIWRNWIGGYPGGPEKAISDGVIIKHNDLMAKAAPNFMAALKKDPQAAKEIKTDSGTIYGFNFIRGGEDLMVFFGPQLRKDWLDDLGLEVPETIAEWETVLTAFKKSGKTDTPLGFTKLGKGRDIAASSAFIQPFRTNWDFYRQDNGKVQFGPMDPQFKDFLTLFKSWYDKGLIDPEFMSLERKAFDAKILNGDVGAWVSYTGSGIGAYLDAKRGSGEVYDLIPAPYPVINKGDMPHFGQRDTAGKPDAMAITTQAKNPELAAEWLDYGYSDEGHILFNFGIEGESFTWVTDYPGFEGEKWAKYTDLMMNNPDGKTLSQMGGLYTRAFYSGPIVQDRQYIFQYANRPAQRDAIKIWAKTDALKHMMPPITSTPDESEDLATIMAEVQTYREEMVIKFITGQEPLSNFAAFQDQLKKMGIDRAIEIKQAGMDRFNAR